MSSNPDLSNIADRYRNLAARFSALVSEVAADRWSSPSPCEGWTALDVVNHVVTTEADLLGRMPFAPADAPDLSEPVRSWPVVRDLVQAALDDPGSAGHAYEGFFGPTTFASTVDLFYSFDLVVHTWDIARATGMDGYTAISPEEMVAVKAASATFGENLRMPGILGPALDVPADADAQTAFLAFLGRMA